MNRLYKAGLLLGIIAGLSITLFNASRFARAFSGPVTTYQDIDQLARLPVQQDVIYRQPAPPNFLSALNFQSADLNLGTSSPLPLLRHKANDQVPLASLTKLMTALVMIEKKPDWQKVVTISADDQRGGARPRIFPGEKINLEGLWQLMLVGSDNDATVALIRGLGFSEIDFVALMNERAADLGLSSTRFTEPTGLSSENVSTAREFSIIARAAFSESRIAKTLGPSTASVLVNGEPRLVLSSDQQFKIFQDARRDGWRFLTGKTGYVSESGYNVTLLAGNERGDKILAVILGSATPEERVTITDRLLKWGFSAAQDKSSVIGRP